ncbi:MAG: hypothetical protein ABUM26_04580 [Solirubrobacterales bacterium]
MSSDTRLSGESWRIAVLSHVLLEHPALLTGEELRRELFVDRQDFSQTDAHDRAVRDLIAAGLLRREGDSIVATRAAVHFYMLGG